MKLFEKSKYFCIFHELPRYMLGLGCRSPFIKSFQAYSPLPLGPLKAPPSAVAPTPSPDAITRLRRRLQKLGGVSARSLILKYSSLLKAPQLRERRFSQHFCQNRGERASDRPIHSKVTSRASRCAEDAGRTQPRAAEEQPAAVRRRNRRKADALGN